MTKSELIDNLFSQNPSLHLNMVEECVMKNTFLILKQVKN